MSVAAAGQGLPARLAALRRVPAPVWLVLAWASLYLPSLPLRSLHWEEGRNAFIALSILQDGDWLRPTVFGEVWLQKPQLLAWLIAALGHVAGGIDEWVVRAPTLLAVLAGALLIRRLVREAGPAASLAAAGFWLVNPFVLTHSIGEPDLLLAVLSFAAFVLWWEGRRDGRRVAWWRWIACGLLLSLVAFAKGPQPVAFFALGVGACTLLWRAWRDIPGLVLCGAMPAALTLLWGWLSYQPGTEDSWLLYMRLRGQEQPLGAYLLNIGDFVLRTAAQALPAILLAVPFWWTVLRRSGGSGRAGGAAALGLALLLYAGLATAVLMFWPAARPRYAAPMLPAVAAAGGLMLPLLWQRRDRLARLLRWAGLGGLAGLAAYRLVLVVLVMPLRPELFDSTRATGQVMTALVAADPAPLLATAQTAHNPAWYTQPVPRIVPLGSLAARTEGAWLVLRRNERERVAAHWPGARMHEALDLGEGNLLIRATPPDAPQ